MKHDVYLDLNLLNIFITFLIQMVSLIPEATWWGWYFPSVSSIYHLKEPVGDTGWATEKLLAQMLPASFMSKERFNVNLLLRVQTSFLTIPTFALLDVFSVWQHLELTSLILPHSFHTSQEQSDHHCHHSNIAIHRRITVIVVAVI